MGWRGTVRILAAIVIFVVAPILWLGVRKLEMVQVARQTVIERTEPSRAFLKSPTYWFLATGFACLAVAHGATLLHLLPILDERGLSAEMAVLAAPFIGPMQVAGRLAMMASERHISNHGVAISAFAILGLSIVMLLFSDSSPALLSGFVILFGGAYGTVSILRPLIAREILGQADFGAKSGALALLYLTGSALSPFVASLLWNVGGYDLMLKTLLGFTALGCLLYWNAHRLVRSE